MEELEMEVGCTSQGERPVQCPEGRTCSLRLRNEKEASVVFTMFSTYILFFHLSYI